MVSTHFRSFSASPFNNAFSSVESNFTCEPLINTQFKEK